jgi:hypothetical protein
VVVMTFRKSEGEPLGDQTYFTVFARWPREVRLFSVEWELIETEAEALEAVKHTYNAALVFRHDPDVPRKDVSEDIARAWLSQIIGRGFDPGRDRLPEFIRQHLSADDVVAMMPVYPLHAAE